MFDCTLGTFPLQKHHSSIKECSQAPALFLSLCHQPPAYFHYADNQLSYAADASRQLPSPSQKYRKCHLRLPPRSHIGQLRATLLGRQPVSTVMDRIQHQTMGCIVTLKPSALQEESQVAIFPVT